MAVLAHKGVFFHIQVLCNGAENPQRRAIFQEVFQL